MLEDVEHLKTRGVSEVGVVGVRPEGNGGVGSVGMFQIGLKIPEAPKVGHSDEGEPLGELLCVLHCAWYPFHKSKSIPSLEKSRDC